MHDDRRANAFAVRVAAATQARDRVHPTHAANGDEQRFASANYAMSFTKGLEHDRHTGLLSRSEDFGYFRRAIDEGFIDAFTSQVRAAPRMARKWEAPTAGVAFDLEGPDAQAVTMAPAPALGSHELAYEMAEVYELGLLRDVPLSDLSAGSASTPVNEAVQRLNDLAYAKASYPGRPRLLDGGSVTAQTAFRGSSPRVEVGPYVSQFLWVGNALPDGSDVKDGYLQYGALRVDQRVPVASATDYLTDWSSWISAQDGVDLRDDATLFAGGGARRFITFPRDMATYVHDDALYEAYLNACLILLSMGTPFDPAFSQLSGQGTFFLNSLNSPNPKAGARETHELQAGGFALYGGPHILTLVTEVATRALKAVRFQKFNTHIRLRPEALAARIEKAEKIEHAFPYVQGAFSRLASALAPVAGKVRDKFGTALLPMAFQEGSPMHPSYGAGHATVAGACITILKAYFNTDAAFVRRTVGGETRDTFAVPQKGDAAVHYEPDASGQNLVATTGGPLLTLEGELNKLAANISIARNMAGVHYFSDYYDSLRMGEQVALGILQEQALTYPTDPFVLTVPTFDGEVVRIGAR